MLTDIMVTFGAVWPPAWFFMTMVPFAWSWNWSFDDSPDSTRFKPRLGRFGDLRLDATPEERDWLVRRHAGWWLKTTLVMNSIFLAVLSLSPGTPSYACVAAIALSGVNMGVSLTLLAVFRIVQSLAEATDRRLRAGNRPSDEDPAERI